jgi:tetratricopeptide (TPR) repeat protein
VRPAWIVPAALLAASWGAARLPPAGQGLPPYARPPLPAYAVQDAFSALAGVRRLGGDVALIQLLQYFATPDPAGSGKPKSQWLLQFYPHSLRFARLSPYFHGAFLFSAGCLGFVLERPEEALSLLEIGAASDPTFWRYRIYAAAIAYRRDQAPPEKLINLLEEALKYPDCPSLLAHILANLHKKLGHYQRAAEIYRYIVQTSHDEHAVWRAQQQLDELIDQRLAR